ncbi:MAG: hypothetical protein C4298_06190 [Thermus sp.]
MRTLRSSLQMPSVLATRTSCSHSWRLALETGVSYFSGRDLRHVRADLGDMVEHGCTYVVHCFTETDLAYNLKGMAEIVRATRDIGLQPWADPWGLCGIFSGETFSRFLLEHPESCQGLEEAFRGEVVGVGVDHLPSEEKA